MSEELLKYILAGAVAGYVPLGVFIWFLVKKVFEAKDTLAKEVAEAKDENITILRETLVQSHLLKEVLHRTNCLTEKLVTFLKD